ncbi:MAG: hypothetical protein P1V97_14095 [Planctomycetota bacterium]|nr:hypothetical protein [Planctomycetota bacterium]
MKREDCLYHAFYCEENIWKLCQQPCFKELETQICVISNEAQCCAFLEQRAGQSSPGFPSEGLVTWDYHVVLLAKDNGACLVYDLDTLLGFPTVLELYLDRTFSAIFPKAYQPIFRLVSLSRFQEEFCSDRSHMLNKHNEYFAPTPPWDAPDTGAGGTNLAELIDIKNEEWGKLYNLASLKQTLLG